MTWMQKRWVIVGDNNRTTGKYYPSREAAERKRKKMEAIQVLLHGVTSLRVECVELHISD